MRKSCAAARFAYNWGLARWKELRTDGQSVDAYRLRREFNAIKREQFPWVMEVTKCAPMSSLLFLGAAFQRHSKGLSGFPKFKRPSGRQSYTVGIESGTFRFEGKKIHITKLGWVDLAEEFRWPDAKLNRITVKSHGSRWHVFVSCEFPGQSKAAVSEKALLQGENQAAVVGIDLGLTHFATLSTGEKIENPRYLERALRRLRILQRSASRKKKGSKNYRKAISRFSDKYAEVSNKRTGFIHKFSSEIASKFDHVVIEDLHVQDMAKLSTIARSAHNAGFNMLRQQLSYKAKKLTVASRWFPSTRMCCNCGYKADLTLADRTWKCPVCNFHHDRDINAAANLKQLGQTAPSPEARLALAACGELCAGTSSKQETCTK